MLKKRKADNKEIACHRGQPLREPPENSKAVGIIFFEIPNRLTQGWNAQSDFFANSKLTHLNKVQTRFTVPKIQDFFLPSPLKAIFAFVG